MKVNVNKTDVMSSGESCKGYRILEDSHVMFVVVVLVETLYSVSESVVV